MPGILQLRHGTAAEAAAETLSVGELYVDTDNNKLYIHDGTTAGGNDVVAGLGGALVMPQDLGSTDSPTFAGMTIGDTTIDAPFQIYQYTNGSFITDAIRTNNLRITTNGDNQHMLISTGNAWRNNETDQGVTLWYDGMNKFSTNANGIDIYGNLIFNNETTGQLDFGDEGSWGAAEFNDMVSKSALQNAVAGATTLEELKQAIANL